MCTVTYIPGNGSCFITSSRDEKVQRVKAIPPAFYRLGQRQLLYPRDAAANGTWISINDAGTGGVLLNGAFFKHEPALNYRKSRGLILLEILSSFSALESFKNISLQNIEPFTLILFFENKLFECRWDGRQKHLLEMDASKRHIWSSVTLYSAEIIAERNNWFNSWCRQNPFPLQQDIIDFHLFAGNGNAANSIRMNRDNQMLTVSITGIQVAPGGGNMLYYDLGGNTEVCKKTIQFNKSFSTP